MPELVHSEPQNWKYAMRFILKLNQRDLNRIQGIFSLFLSGWGNQGGGINVDNIYKHAKVD